MARDVRCLHVCVAAGAEDVSWGVRDRASLAYGAVAVRRGACFSAVWEMAEVRTRGSPEGPGTDVNDVFNHPEWAGGCLPHVIAHIWDAKCIHNLLLYVGGSSLTGPVGQVRAVMRMDGIINVLFNCRCQVRHVGELWFEAWEASDEARPGREGGEVVRRNTCAIIVTMTWVLQGIRCSRVCTFIAMDPYVRDYFLQSGGYPVHSSLCQ